MAASHGIDEYLETIYFLAFPIGEYRPTGGGTTQTIAARVAEMLGVSRASAGEMLKRLEAEGFVERGEHKEAILTAAGAERARKVVRKHRVIERLLTDFMGYTPAEAHVHADELGATFSDDMIERIEAKLGHPDRCPHGWPVDPDVEQEENRELEALSDLAEGDAATIVRLAEHDGELLHWFYDEGLVPGALVELRAAEPAAGQFRVAVEGEEKAIGEKAAAGLLVRRTDPDLVTRDRDVSFRTEARPQPVAAADG
ncbi:MAG TPA: metal-dependent transcriptional regulator [Gaiellaceae bacterium]|nr:metal-dependent transcriptional regulator [Gaiellaceae bacterium]